MARPRPDETIRAKVEELHAQGLHDGEIGQRLGLCNSTISRYRARSGLPPWPRRRMGGGKPIYDHATIEDMLRDRVPRKQIAATLGCTLRTVERVAKMAGLAAEYKKLPPLEERLEKAKADLEEGASYKFVMKKHHIGHSTIHKYLPGYGWTREEVGQYASISAQANKLYKKLGI